MPHPDRHPRSDPESTFDQWLDAFVSGTPGDAASLDGTGGSLGRAISGARQLHGLAAGTIPAAAAQRRVEEDLMRNGALAAPRGTTWIPIEKEARRGPWWSPASPVLAAALVVALIIALSASFISSQRPASNQPPTESRGFAALPESPAILPAQNLVPLQAGCDVTAPNGEVPPGENADLNWLGSGAENPSLWLMMTWDDGTIETNRIAGGYSVKLTFWRGEGSGEVTVTAAGPDGETLPADTFEAFQGDPIPGLHPFGGTLPEAGCWTFTATDGNDTLTWTVDVQELAATPAASPAASPVAASAPNAVMVIEGSSADARIENSVAIATLGDDGLTLPIAGGVSVALPRVVQVDNLGPNAPGTLHVMREDGTEAVIDLTTGDVLFEVPPFENWTRGIGQWRFVPTDATLTAWNVTDMTTGETRLLSDLIDLPGDSAVMPSGVSSVFANGASVFQLELGRPENTGFVSTDPAARTFVIAGSFDRVALLPDYPSIRDNVGDPTLVSSADGGTVAYETRAGDSRIVILDVASGRVLARYTATEVGENPALAGFTGDGRVIATDGTRLLALDPAGRVTTVADGFERIDESLIHVTSGMVYARDIDRLEQIDLATGEVTEIAIDLLPGSFGFTKLSSDWIVFPTRDRVMMLDARTGMVVSETWFPGFGPSPADAERRPGWVGGDGDTYILGVQALTVPPSVPTSQPTAWILSPNFPEGLVVTAPDTARNYWLSPDGKTLYAYTSERPNGPGTIWRTPLGETPDWQVVVEEVTPLPVPMMFWPGE